MRLTERQKKELHLELYKACDKLGDLHEKIDKDENIGCHLYWIASTLDLLGSLLSDIEELSD